MGMQINHNIAALNAWRNLGISNSSLSSSLEKLSSGYRINRGSDDPAGLLISEKLRAQIGGLDQAMANASDAISMVQTAEGALTEINNMLNSIRTLAVHASNTGANDSSSIAADQTAVDKAVESVQRIATTTKFAGKSLLDGTAGTTVSNLNSGNFSTFTAGSADNSGTVNLVVGTVAEQASFTFGDFVSDGSTSGELTVIITNGSSVSAKSWDWSGGAKTLASVINEINNENLGVSAGSDGAGSLRLVTNSFGDHVSLQVITVGSLFNSAGTAINSSDSGVDVVGTLDGDTLGASGLTLYGNASAGWANFVFTLSTTANVASTVGQLSIVVGNLQFSLTDNAATSDIITYGINDMQSDTIGTVSTLSGSNLDAIKDGGTYDLDSNAAAAVQIIDAAINTVSTERANLGAFQKYTLETTINNLGITKENLVSSESRIRDVDMASEMMEFTKNQILVQAGTAMLAQANQLPQSVLQLLG